MREVKITKADNGFIVDVKVPPGRPGPISGRYVYSHMNFADMVKAVANAIEPRVGCEVLVGDDVAKMATTVGRVE